MKRDSSSINLSKSHREFKKADSVGSATGLGQDKDLYNKSAANSPSDQLTPSYSMGDVFRM
jgi:hypothetical protein